MKAGRDHPRRASASPTRNWCRASASSGTSRRFRVKPVAAFTVSRAIAAAQGRAREGHRQGQVRRRHVASGHAARADSQAAGARRDAEERRHVRRREGDRRAGGAGRRPDRRAPRAAGRGRPGAAAHQGAVRAAAAGPGRQDHLRPPAQDRAAAAHWWARAATLRRARSWPRRSSRQTYLNSYVAHAPMETHSAVATIEDGKAHRVGEHAGAVLGEAAGRRRRWASRRRTCASSRPTSAAASAARAGRRAQAVEAARLAKTHRQARAGGVGPRRGVLLRHLPAGGGASRSARA